jgi:CheY-like chemotaxis protein
MTTTSDDPRTVDILLVEDSAGDARLAIEALREAGGRHRVSWVKDGVEAIEFLLREGGHADAPRPDIILLDLNLPKKDGREVLEEIKANEELHRIPVVVLTTSQSIDDVQRMYNLHANCYVAKPVDLDRFMDIVSAIDAFWLSTVSLPPHEN